MHEEIKRLDLKIARVEAAVLQYDTGASSGIPASRPYEIEAGRREPSPEIPKREHMLLKGK